MLNSTRLILLIVAMCIVVVASNFLVQYPVNGKIGALNLADLLTWGAFTYPAAFLITDLANRMAGPATARKIVLVGFIIAVGFSYYLATPRIAIASGTAFMLAQMLDVTIFDKLRHGTWWRAPMISSLLGSTLDTLLFFSLAFAPYFMMLGPNDDFAIANAPMLGVFAVETPRWISWAIGDFGVKILVGASMLIPYGILRNIFTDKVTTA